jgi:hypothetical protein
MSAAAVTDRLRELQRLFAEQGLRRKGVDVSVAGVTSRLRTLGALSDMCLRLAAAGKGPGRSGPRL